MGGISWDLVGRAVSLILASNTSMLHPCLPEAFTFHGLVIKLFSRVAHECVGQYSNSSSSLTTLSCPEDSIILKIMADVVAQITSMMTIAAGVIKGVKYARIRHRAAEELEIVQVKGFLRVRS